MARKPATDEQKAAVRANIRNAALALYREQGLNNLTARTIAVRAGISVGTIYTHFGNLNELAQSLWQGPVEKFEDELKTRAAQHQQPAARLKSLLMTYLEFAGKNVELYRAVFMFVRAPGETPVQQPFTNSVFADLLITVLKEGQREGIFIAAQPVSQAQILWSALHGLIALPINIDRFSWAGTDELHSQMINGLLRMIQVDPASAS